MMRRRDLVWATALSILACGGPEVDSDSASDTRPGPGDPSGDPGGDPSGDPSGGSGGLVCDGAEHTGEATYYAADGSGNCSFAASPGDPMIAAMNHTDYAASAACGACVQIDGPDGQVVVRIVDRCPECPQGDIDLSEGAFAMIAAPELGRVPITWRWASCDVAGPIVYHFKEGSNEWWTAVQIRNHRNAIATVEVADAMGQWKSVPRLDYNYFVDEAGMGPGPYRFRVTDISGNVLEDMDIPLTPEGDVQGAGQFPACAP